MSLGRRRLYPLSLAASSLIVDGARVSQEKRRIALVAGHARGLGRGGVRRVLRGSCARRRRRRAPAHGHRLPAEPDARNPGRRGAGGDVAGCQSQRNSRRAPAAQPSGARPRNAPGSSTGTGIPRSCLSESTRQVDGLTWYDVWLARLPNGSSGLGAGERGRHLRNGGPDRDRRLGASAERVP